MVVHNNFQRVWKEKTSLFQKEHSDPWIPLEIQRQVFDVLDKVAEDGKPLLNLASNFDLGLIPYLVKRNPHIMCLASDYDEVTMKAVRRCIDTYLPTYGIEVASFDSWNMPIRSESLDVVTSQGGITFSAIGLSSAETVEGKRKAIREVYRVLKPSGQFVTLERSVAYGAELMKLYDDQSVDGKLFGLYTRDEIRAVCEKLSEESLRVWFTEAGFQVETEATTVQKSNLAMVQQFLLTFTRDHGIHCFEKEEWETLSQNLSLHSHSGTDHHLFTATSFFVLRKPE